MELCTRCMNHNQPVISKEWSGYMARNLMKWLRRIYEVYINKHCLFTWIKSHHSMSPYQEICCKTLCHISWFTQAVCKPKKTTFARCHFLKLNIGIIIFYSQEWNILSYKATIRIQISCLYLLCYFISKHLIFLLYPAQDNYYLFGYFNAVIVFILFLFSIWFNWN